MQAPEVGQHVGPGVLILAHGHDGHGAPQDVQCLRAPPKLIQGVGQVHPRGGGIAIEP